MKKSTLVLLTIFSAVSLAVVGISVNNSPISAFLNATNAEDKTTTITLNSLKKPTIANGGSGSLDYNTFASFTYTNASENANGHVSLADGGTIYKDQESNGLSTFTATFSGNLELYTGYSGSDDECYKYTLKSEFPTTIRGNYFKLISKGTTDISEIVIEFGCEQKTADTEDEHNFSEEWTHDETHHWRECTDDNCVRKGDYAAHTPTNVAQVKPTETETGLTAGTVCSVCGRVFSGREVLPVLDKEGVNYYFRNRTTRVGDVVADFEEYTWKNDSSVVIYANPGEALTNYIHAGSSYYSIETWNDMFENQEAVTSGSGDNRTLTITLKGDTTVLAEDRVSNLDGTFDLLLYKNVVINGSGTLNITYTENQDGIICYNLTIGEGVTLNLTGNDATKKTGISFAGTLQIDGTYNVGKFANGIGINTNNELIPGCSTATDLITVNGTLSINNCSVGIHSWNTPSGGATIDFNGDVDITNIASTGIYLDSAVTVNFNGGTVDISSSTNGIYAKYMAFNFNGDVDVHITTVEIGINLSLANPDADTNKMTMNSDSKLTIVSSDGSGIYCNGGGIFAILDNSQLNITAASSGIYNFKQFRAYNGGKNETTMNTTSVIIQTSGVTGTTGGKTSTAYGIYGRDTYNFVDVGFRTTGKVLIENTGTKGGTGIYFGKTKQTKDKNNKTVKNGNIVIYGCTNFTIKNFSTAVGMNTSSQEPSLIKYGGVAGFSDSVKIDVVDCTTIVSGPTGTWFTNHFSDDKFR